MRQFSYSFLVLSFIFLAGCGQQEFSSSPLSAARQIFEPKKQVEYQYAAPWDTQLYDRAVDNARAVPDTLPKIKGGIVPHHLLAGTIDAEFFKTIAKQKPSVVVIIGPNHFSRGTAPIITTNRDWQTPYGVVETHHGLVQNLQDWGLVEVDEAVMKEEHSVYGLIPFISKLLPHTRVLSLIVKNTTSTSTLNALVEELDHELPQDAVIVASIDFSHYQTTSVSKFHDELSMSVIRNFDYDRLSKLEIDSIPSLYTLLKLMEAYGTEQIAHEIHSDAGTLTGNPMGLNVTSYYSPYFTEGKRESKKVASILFFGDIMIDRNVKKLIDVNGTDYLLEKLAGEEGRFFSGMDIVHANLEGPFADERRPTTKSIAFRFDPILIPMLQKYNFSLFTAANNHSLDMGRAGFAESQENLKKAGIHFYGSEYEVNDDSYLLEQIGNMKIVFIGVNDTHTLVDVADVTLLIGRGKKEADRVVLNIHWGAEYEPLSNARQRAFAHALIDAGADVIIGHHPHVVEEIEVYKDKPIFYSLGNFIFDQYFSIPTQQGLGIGLVFHDDKTSIYVFPLQGVQSQVTLMKGLNSAQFMQNLIDRSKVGEYTINNFNFTIPFSSYE